MSGAPGHELNFPSPERATHGTGVARTPTCGAMWTVSLPGRRRRPRVSTRPRTTLAPQSPTPPTSGRHPGTPAPDARLPAVLPGLWLTHYLRLRLVPGSREVPLRDAAGGREPLRHAGRSSAQQPSRAALRRSGRAARTRGAAYRRSPAPRIPAGTCRPPLRPAPRASRSPGSSSYCAPPGLPHPRPSRGPSRPRVCPPPPAPIPPRFLLWGRTSGSQIPPLSRLSAAPPPRFMEVTWWSRNPEGRRSPPTGDSAGAGGAGEGEAHPACLGSRGCSQGIGVRNTSGWFGVVVFFPVPSRHLPAQRPRLPQRKGHGLGGLSPRRSVSRAGAALTPSAALGSRAGEAQAREGQPAFRSPPRAPRPRGAPGRAFLREP